MSKKKKTERFSFPTIVRCPRCSGLQTRAVSTQGKIQYRRCMAPVCQERFSIRGTPIKRKSKPAKPATNNQQTATKEAKGAQSNEQGSEQKTRPNAN